MAPSLLTPDERTFVAGYAQGWIQLSSCENERDEFGELFNPQDQYIDTLIHDFFARFLYRDMNSEAADARAFPIGVRDTLHTRLKRILYVEASKVIVDEDNSDDEYVAFGRSSTFRTLFKQRYRSQILSCRDRICQDRDPTKLFDAYNLAVEQELGRMSRDAPEDMEELKRLAIEIRTSAKRKFEDQPAEIQDMYVGPRPVFPGD
ncbi:hypothetical protein RhiJN_15049 [Ceratobasidium sp. AG-Ba]|nr:hypothetical protein RhiJN_15049 [Ceratobasidium sp. AG-Ba]